MPHSRTSRWSIRRWTAGPSERYASAAETAPHVGFSATCVPPRRPRRRSSTPSATRETRARRTVISPTSSPVSRFPHTRMAVFPELRLCGVDGFGPETHEELHEIAEPLDGPRVKALAELAGDLGLWLLRARCASGVPRGQLYNTAVVLSPDGRLAASYRKVLSLAPQRALRPGRPVRGLRHPRHGRRIVLAICYDAWFHSPTAGHSAEQEL